MNHLCRQAALTLCLWLSGLGGLSAVELPFDDRQWTIRAEEHRIETFDGRQTLYLENGMAALVDLAFLDGVIEFEVMMGEKRGFSGARWRGRAGGNYEEFYLRPHQSGKYDANQYQPVFNGVDGWQIYYGSDFSTPTIYHPGQWTKVRIEVLGDRAQIYINSRRPVLVIDLKHETRAGAIALFSGFEAARFSRFRYELTKNIDIADIEQPEGDGPERKTAGLLRHWQISDAVAESAVDGKTRLSGDVLSALKWHELAVESNGVANLARIQGLTGGNDTAFARLILESEVETVQRLDFGFSDRIRIYANGTLLYWGSDRWQSRDYRFLGTVGTYSAVFLPLRPGRNEILLAVSESFGGWAVTGNLVPEPGVRIVTPSPTSLKDTAP